MSLVKSPKECLVCLSTDKTVFVPTEESQKIFNVCCSYVKDAINIEFLINNIIGNNSSLSFCKNCLDCSLNLSQLVEQLSHIKKEISDLSTSFAETITKQRIQATKCTRKRKFNGNVKFHSPNNQKANLDSSDGILLQVLPLAIGDNDSEKNPFIHFEASNESINEDIVINEIGSEIVKTENSGIFLDYEDESYDDNVSGCNEEEYETNYLATDNEPEGDPFGEIEQESSSGIVNSITTVYQTNPQIGEYRSVSKLGSSVTIPNITLLDLIQNDMPANKGGTCTKRNKELMSQKNRSGGSSSNSNCRAHKTNFRSKSRQIPGREYKHICSICQKSFWTSSKLKRHHVTHTGEKPYKCSICERAFTQSSSLKSHERLHTGEEPYKCSLCHRSFVRMRLLKDHLKTHT